MSYVYRYIDKKDNVIKYVGIVWGETRTIDQRTKEHRNDEWYKKGKWKVEYIDLTDNLNITTRTDAEYVEAHLINLYKTDNWFNKSKAGWGTSSFVNFDDKLWIEYVGKKGKVCKKGKYILGSVAESNPVDNIPTKPINQLKKAAFFNNMKKHIMLRDINEVYKMFLDKPTGTDYYLLRLKFFKKFCECFNITHWWCMKSNSKGWYPYIQNWNDFLKCNNVNCISKRPDYHFLTNTNYPYMYSGGAMDHQWCFYSDYLGELFIVGMPYPTSPNWWFPKEDKDSIRLIGLSVSNLGNTLSFHYPGRTTLNIISTIEFAYWARERMEPYILGG